MTQEEFVSLLKRLAENGIQVHEQVNMYDADEPILDDSGEQVVNDVVIVGDGRVYIERDDNDLQAAQDLIDFLAGIDTYLPDLITMLEED